VPIDAERWLASRGVVREPLIGPEPARTDPAERPPGVREVVDAARQAAADGSLLRAAAPTPESTAAPEAEMEAAADIDGADADAALAFIRRSTSNAPQSEGRLRTKLLERGYEESTVEAALVGARAERLVDDDALLAALIAERRTRGHADLRLRRDLRDRGFTGPQVDAALETHAHTDPAAAAFALAREQAGRHRGLDAEVAVRRTVGFLVRRGHGEGLARKAARDAVYADREAQEVAGR
jgi:SOS response regulatory protein OraA/RecX